MLLNLDVACSGCVHADDKSLVAHAAIATTAINVSIATTSYRTIQSVITGNAIASAEFRNSPLPTMSRPRRTNAGKASTSQRMISWDKVDLGDEEQGFSEDQNDSSTDFGSDDIYSASNTYPRVHMVTDLLVGEPDMEEDVIPDDGVQEALPTPEEILISGDIDTIARDLERDFTYGISYVQHLVL
jgi:hypothetical protein